MKVIIKPHPKSLVDKMAGNGLEMAAEQIMNDCNFFAKQQSGDLIGSSSKVIINATQIAIHWSTPYAAKQYYTGTPSHAMNPNASLMWAEKANRIFGNGWALAIEEGMKR